MDKATEDLKNVLQERRKETWLTWPALHPDVLEDTAWAAKAIIESMIVTWILDNKNVENPTQPIYEELSKTMTDEEIIKNFMNNNK